MPGSVDDMLDFLWGLLLLLCFAHVLVFCGRANAEVRQLSLDVRKMKDARLAYYPNKNDFTSYVGLNWDVGHKLGLGLDTFWENRTYFYGDSAQVRYIGWEFDVGVGTDKIQLIYHHHSEHRADSDRYGQYSTGAKFPLENSFGVKLCFIGCK